jgi:hypothetical protein
MRLRNLRIEPLEFRAMLTVVAQGVQSFPTADRIAVDNTAAEQPITGLPQTLTGTAGVALGTHSGVGYGEVIAAVRQDISADQEVFTTAIDWGDGATTNGSAFVDLSLASDTQHRTYSVFAVHTFTQPGTYPITVVFSENGAAEATVTSTAIIGGTANQQFVDHIYQDLLGRAPDSGGLTTWLARLDGGLSRSAFIDQVEQSAEYRGDEVMAIYQQYLQRPADSAALETGSELLAQGATDEQLAEMVVSSPEYFALHGGANDGFLAALFQDALNRPIDAGAKAAFGQALAAGANRSQIAAIVFASHEYHADVVDAAYLQLLRRHSDATGQSFWANLLDAGVTDEQLIAALAASDEYFNRSA